jgi:replicative DNA helicase
MDENLIKKVPPHSEQAERSVIGSMMMDKDAISVATEILQPTDFYEPKLGIYFKVMTELAQEGTEADLVTIQDRLKKEEIPEEYASLEYLAQLVDAVPTSANVKYYAEIVREKSLLRQLIKASEKIANTCYLDKEETAEIFGKAEKDMFAILQKSNNSRDLTEISEIVLDTLNNIEMAAKNKGAVTGIPTGFLDLDYMTAGMQPADLVIVAARPSMGKTAFVLNMAEYMAVRNNQTTAIFSLEMSKTQLVNRMLAMNSKINAQSLRTGKLDDSEWAELVESARAIGGSALVIDDTPAISVGELRQKCRKLKLERNLKCVIIDYIQLMTLNHKAESEQQKVSEISRTLKAIAREIECPVIALSQLSRAVESRPDKRPMLSDLRESGAIEQDADVVMFIYRDEYYLKDKSEHPGEAEIIIAKQRNGPVGTVNLKWLGEYTKFANLAKNEH